MTSEKQHDAELEEEDTIKAQRDAALIAIGIDPETVVWPESTDLSGKEAAEHDPVSHIREEDWLIIAPQLPAEPPQVRAMSNREFFEEVLRAMQRRGVWTTRQRTAAETEAIRRRFGRWSHLGVFQDLEAKLESADLPRELKSAIALAAKRAESLRRRAAGRGRK